ncbi:MAG: DUF1800 domain-containing protein [Planctomycetota bacterium]
MSAIWKPYAPSTSQPWGWDRAKHLHRRAAVGPTWSELTRDAADGPENSVARILNGTSRVDGQRDDFEEMSQILGDAAAGSDDENRLKAWWLFRILFTPDPLREKLALLWHNHFATSNLKVQDLLLMKQQNELFRQYATAKFSALVLGVLRDPAMLYWLDANSNRKGRPNENLARELMELFTLGVGAYDENDVQEAARALTGWTVKRADVKFRPDRHDDEEKTILGQTARYDADSLAQLLLYHPAASRRLAWRLCELFMGEGVVSEAALDELAEGMRRRELDIGWAVETILRSELFFSDKNIASRVSSPVEFVVGAVRSLQLYEKPPSTLILAEWCTRLGQDLFYPPNVGGWQGGRNWLTTRTIIGRSNFAAALFSGERRAPAEPPALESLARELGVEHFEKLLLSRPCGKSDGAKKPTDLPNRVAQLLSCPDALVC